MTTTLGSKPLARIRAVNGTWVVIFLGVPSWAGSLADCERYADRMGMDLVKCAECGCTICPGCDEGEGPTGRMV